MDPDSDPDDPTTVRIETRERRKKKGRGESGPDLRGTELITEIRYYKTMETSETLTHTRTKQEKGKGRRDSKAKENTSAIAANAQIRATRLVKNMGRINTGHLKEIKELEVVIEQTRSGERRSETTRRTHNTMRRETERTRKVEKKENLNKERTTEKEADRSTSRENLLNKKRGRDRLFREEGNYSVHSSSQTGDANCGVLNIVDATKILENTSGMNGMCSDSEEANRSNQNSSEGSTTKSVSETESRVHQSSAHEHGSKAHRVRTRLSGKSGKIESNQKILSKSQVKKMARNGGRARHEPVGEGPNKYKTGEISSRRVRGTGEKGLIDIMDADEVSTDGESEDIRDEEEEGTKGRHPFWTTPPR